MVIHPLWWVLVSVRMLVRGRLPLSHRARNQETATYCPVTRPGQAFFEMTVFAGGARHRSE